ncbi:MAG: peptidoglycan-binding protein [Devosia nanyangense]|uniref:Peptidoglycan-binding protein n=1 Tax=Devosia nanyangense TaxID=1228055 RepID=A0A933L519_9HYPH|nr:peptidoglycan-binding protein [Devosia nanyangense]
MLSTFLKSTLAVAFAAFATASQPVLAADEAVRQAQKLLIALGYKIGSADGVSGKRTEAAVADAMANYGQTYDGTLSDNEVLLLARVAPSRVTVDFEVAVSELNHLHSADINGDGRLDFVVTAMSDTAEQLGIPCCEVPANRVPDITPPVPILVYSTPEGYATKPFPPEAKGNRSQAGRFFTAYGKQYFVLAKNGEMGLPSENHGEISMVFRITPSEDMAIETVAEFDGRGVSANVDVADLDGDGQPEIFLNNYGLISTVTSAGGSVIKTFTSDEKLASTKFTAPIESRKPMNYVSLIDFDGSGNLDLLVAVEIEKTMDGSVMLAKAPGSYVILDPFVRKTAELDRIYLLPPFWGNDHAGYSILPITVDGRILMFEISQQFLGHQGGGFINDHLDVFEYSTADKAFTLVTADVLPKQPRMRDKSSALYLQRADLDFDGIDEVYRQQYPYEPQFFEWNGKAFALTNFPSKDFFKPNWTGTLIYLPDPELKCTRMVTFSQNLGGNGGQTKTDLRLTSCVPMGD